MKKRKNIKQEIKIMIIINNVAFRSTIRNNEKGSEEKCELLTIGVVFEVFNSINFQSNTYMYIPTYSNVIQYVYVFTNIKGQAQSKTKR